MLSLKDLRKRIRTVVNTRQITKAMKAVAVSKLRRVQTTMEGTRRYGDVLARITGHLLAAAPDLDHPLRRIEDPIRKRTLVLVTADRGLCGAFNNNIIDHARKYIDEVGKDTVELYCVGKKGRDFFRKRGVPIIKEHIDFNGNLDVQRAASITDDLVERFEAGETDHVVLLYNSFVNMMTYHQKTVEFLPLDPSELLGDDAEGDSQAHGGDIIFEPDAATVFGVTLARYLRVRMVTTLADGFTAEHSARMVSMTTASDNCDELLISLTLQRNKARQAAITKELLEIVSGAEALKG